MPAGRNILIIEDEINLAELYEIKFKAMGYAVTTADNGLKGLELARSIVPDIILLDIVMPKMDGYQTLTELKKDEKTKGVPVILFSNLGQKEEIEKGINLGAVDFVIKASLTPTDLVKKVEDTLATLTK